MGPPQLYRFEAVGPAAALEAAYALADGDPPLALSASLFEHGGPDARRLELIFDALPDRDAVLAVLGLTDAEVATAVGALEAQDWVALSLAGLPPVEAGRFRLRGSHDAPREGGCVDLLIEAGEAFGTGHHATTRGCLLALHHLLRKRTPQRTLDLGTGTGALAIAVARAVRRPVLATDIDPVAVRVARENVLLNGAAGLVDVIEADGFAARELCGRRFDLVVANILAGPLEAMAGAIVRACAPGGTIVLSGLLEPQARGVLAAFRAHGARVVRRYVLEGWATLVLATSPAPAFEQKRLNTEYTES
jgi:ribosomal protein L11 methyltransferase